MNAASRAANENELKILGDGLEIYNVYAREFPWNTEPKPSWRRKLSGGDLTTSGQHLIDPSGVGCVEIYEVGNSDRRNISLPTSQDQDPANDKITQDSLELSSPKVSSPSPSSVKERSTDTTSTLSLPFDDLTGTSIIVENIHNA